MDAARDASKDPAERANFEAEFTKASRLLWQREAKLNPFCEDTGRKKLVDRVQVEGYNRCASSIAAIASAQDYEDWADSMGISKALPEQCDYYALKNNDPTGYGLLRGYVKAVEVGDVSPLVGYRVYHDTANAVTNGLASTKILDEVEIKGFVTHFVDRVIGQIADPHAGKREGVTLAQAQNALVFGEIRDVVRSDGKMSRIYTTPECAVTMNPVTGILIQTNPRKGKYQG